MAKGTTESTGTKVKVKVEREYAVVLTQPSTSSPSGVEGVTIITSSRSLAMKLANIQPTGMNQGLTVTVSESSIKTWGSN